MAVVFLAAVSMAAHYGLRVRFDGAVVLGVEFAVGALLLFVANRNLRGTRKESSQVSTSQSRPQSTSGSLSSLLLMLCLTFPWLVDSIARVNGYGNAMEILMMAGLAWGGLAISFSANSLRALSMSVVASGFLVLFSTFISEYSSAILFVYVWLAACLWWLLNNYWENVSCLAAGKIESSTSTRWAYLILSAAMFLVATGATWKRIPVLRRLQAEVMPTSGGTSGKDSAARSGIGDGDALVAARKHAASFGAVETDFFLDSEKPSLFDVFSEEFGEPKRSKRVERAQALNPNDVQSDEGRFSEANRSGGKNEFSIDRDPPRKRHTPKDLFSESLMFWEGAQGIRLAAKRYSRFDGTNWVNEQATAGDAEDRIRLEPIELEERTWFRPASKSVQNSISPFLAAVPEALKFTRFRSPEIPVRAGTHLWSIDQITQPEFFAYTKDDCLFMPDRKHVPDYTVVRFVNSRVDQERVENLLRKCAPGNFHRPSLDSCQSEIAALAHEYSDSAERGLTQVNNVIDGLRRDFRFTRESAAGEFSLHAFLQRKEGPSYLFATAAALMLDHLGYETRLVTGFYVSPEHYSAKEKATAILTEDAHAWIEINVGHNYWIPLEPTPGFRKPKLSAGLLYLARKNWQALTVGAIGSMLCLGGIYSIRSLLFGFVCRIFYPVLRLAPDRSRLAWLCWMLDVRWLLIGHPRPPSRTQSRCFVEGKWELEPQGQQQMLDFLRTVDHVHFGGIANLSPAQRSLTHTILNHILQIKASKRPTCQSHCQSERQTA